MLDRFEETTGFPGPDDYRGESPETERPLLMAWMSDELIANTRRVWSKAYERSLSEDDAVEILTNVKHLAEALMRAKRGGFEG